MHRFRAALQNQPLLLGVRCNAAGNVTSSISMLKLHFYCLHRTYRLRASWKLQIAGSVGLRYAEPLTMARAMPQLLPVRSRYKPEPAAARAGSRQRSSTQSNGRNCNLSCVLLAAHFFCASATIRLLPSSWPLATVQWLRESELCTRSTSRCSAFDVAALRHACNHFLLALLVPFLRPVAMLSSLSHRSCRPSQ